MKRRTNAALRIARYNWPIYAGTAAASVGAFACLQLWHAVAAWVSWLALAPLVWGAVSLAVSWYVYDLSDLHSGGWLPDLLPTTPTRWVLLHAGLDEEVSLGALPGDGRRLDLYDPARTPTGSIARAQSDAGKDSETARFDALPLASGTADAIFTIFAAHELRESAQRRALFCEAARCLRSDGTLVLIEHLRDLPNLLAFGPGCLHFYSRGEWLAAASAARLELWRERRITPFVRALAFRTRA